MHKIQSSWLTNNQPLRHRIHSATCKVYTVEPAYNNIGLYDTSRITSDTVLKNPTQTHYSNWSNKTSHEDRKDGGQLTCKAANEFSSLEGDLITLASLQVKLPGSPLAYRILRTLISDSFIHSFSSLSCDRSKASSKASSPHSAIQRFLLQMRVSSHFPKIIQ